MKYLSALILIGSLFFVSCSDNSSGSERGTFDAIIGGTITNSTGNTVSNASVLVISHSLECYNIQGDGISHGTTNTNSEGKFGKRLQSFSEGTIRCLKLEINPPANSSLNDTTVSIPTMLELKTSTPLDEANYEITY